MGKINWPRLIFGGVVAGLIINAFEYVLNGVVLAKDMEAATNALGRHIGGPELLMFTTWAFLVGIVAVWLYAAIRPRYGAGPKAAVCAAEKPMSYERASGACSRNVKADVLSTR
jgi:hypothetical protein